MNPVLRPLLILSLLGLPASAQSLSGSGESPVDALAAEPESMQCSRCDPPENPEPPSPPVLNGKEIHLPLLNPQMLPSGWCFMPVVDGEGHIHPCMAYRAEMNWGGGNLVRNVTQNSWYSPDYLYYGRIVTEVDPGSAFVPIAQVEGAYETVEPGLVRGSVELLIPNQPGLPTPAQGQLIIAIQVLEPTGWRDVSHFYATPITNLRQMHEVEAVVDPHRKVRFEVRVKAHPSTTTTYLLWKARMFGVECVPDHFKPGMCI